MVGTPEPADCGAEASGIRFDRNIRYWLPACDAHAMWWDVREVEPGFTLKQGDLSLQLEPEVLAALSAGAHLVDALDDEQYRDLLEMQAGPVVYGPGLPF